MKRAALIAVIVLLASAAFAVQGPAEKQPQQGSAGTGVSGTHATGVTDKGSAGAHDNEAFSQPDAKPPVAPSPVPPASDAKAGAEVAARGVPEKGAPPCGSCHGANGEGNPATGFPRLAGQPQQYLAKQLDDYADGSRTHAMMTPIAKGLDVAQRRDVSAYFAALTPPSPASAPSAAPPPAAQGPDLEHARVLARSGDERAHVQACANCHGIGLPPLYPALAAQPQAYLASALTQWRNGSRHNDASGQMPAIAKALSESDIAALAAMYATLPAPYADALSAHAAK